MKKTKLLAGITALLMVLSAASLTGCGTQEEMIGSGEITDDLQSAENKTVNEDDNNDDGNEENEYAEIYDKMTVEFFNEAASALADQALSSCTDLETEEVYTNKLTYSDLDIDDIDSLEQGEQRILNSLITVAEQYGIRKWIVVITAYDFDVSCVTGDDILHRSGAYPAMIPRSLNIPYSQELVEYAAIYNYDWKEKFGMYTSSDPAQAELSDYSVQNGLDSRYCTAKDIWAGLQTIAQDYETQDKNIDGIISSDDSTEFTEELKRYLPEYVNVKWKADITWNYVNGVIIDDPVSGYCGAYPNVIPDNMNIPYSDDLLPYACNIDTFWETDFSEYITNIPEQLQAAELTGKASSDELDHYAKLLYTNAMTLLQEYEKNGVLVEFDGSPSRNETQEKFIDELSRMMPAEFTVKRLEWNIIIKDFEVSEAMVSDGENTVSYPVS